MARQSSRETLRLRMEDVEEIQAHDQLLARLDAAPEKPGLRRQRIARGFVSDAKQIHDPMDEDLFEEDLMGAIALVCLAARP